MYLFVALERHGGKEGSARRLPVVIGALAAAAFLLRPNLVGLWIAIGMYWTIGMIRPPRALRSSHVAWSVAGAVAVFLGLYICLRAIGGWSGFIDAVFVYNIAYSDAATSAARVEVAVDVVKHLPFLLPGWALGLYLWLHGDVEHGRRSLLMLALIWLPVEIMLVSLSGRQYGHYYLSMLPVSAVLAAFLADVCVGHVRGRVNGEDGARVNGAGVAGRAGRWSLPLTAGALAAVAVIAYVANFVFQDVGFFRDRMIDRFSRVKILRDIDDDELLQGPYSAVVDRIRTHTSPRDRILVWGAESQIYLFSERRAPTRFFYQYPLVTPGYDVHGELFDEFVSDVARHEPALIIDTRNPALPPLDPEERLTWLDHRAGLLGRYSRSYSYLPGSFRPFFALVEKDYRPSGEIGGYAVYERN